MIFNYNEGMHRIGLLPQDHYITGFEFILRYVFMVILVVGYYKIVVQSNWYEERQTLFESIIMKLLPAAMLITMGAFLLMEFYFKEYGAILILTATAAITLTIAVRKEFAGLRAYLDEKFGWLF
jgi:hypothetical protein